MIEVGRDEYIRLRAIERRAQALFAHHPDAKIAAHLELALAAPDAHAALVGVVSALEHASGAHGAHAKLLDSLLELRELVLRLRTVDELAGGRPPR